MLKKEFVELVVNEIKSIVGDNAEVRHNEMRKNNGVVLNGISILMPEETISPVAYIESYVKDECETDENEIHNIAIEIITTIAEFRNNPITQIDKDNFTNFEYVKNKLRIILLNYNANREMLENLPHEIFLDLAVICCIKVGDNGMIKVSNDLLNTYGITKGTLFDIAYENTPKLEPAVGMNIEKLMFGLVSEELDDFILDDTTLPMYVLTNKSKYYGATTILYNGLLDKLSSNINKDLLVIPSSIHEALILPYKNGLDSEVVTDMVRDVNQKEVQEEEILSNHAYIYRRDTKKIEII